MDINIEVNTQIEMLIYIYVYRPIRAYGHSNIRIGIR